MSSPHDSVMRELLLRSKTIAVVGMSEKPLRDSHQVGRFLMERGYRVVPVNPTTPQVLGLTSYPSIQEVPTEVEIEIVDVFRRSEEVPAVVEAALARDRPPKAIWLQLGVRDEGSHARVASRGVQYYQDLCIMVQHTRLLGP